MKFKVGDKVIIANISSTYNRTDKRFIGTKWEVWEVKNNGEYVLSFGPHRAWKENDLISVREYNLQKAIKELKEAKSNINWLEKLDFKDEINRDLDLLIEKLKILCEN